MATSDITEPLIYEDDAVASRQQPRRSPVVAYIGLCLGVAAVAIGAVALYEVKSSHDATAQTQQAANDANQLQVMTSAHQSMSSNMITSHPACQGTVNNWRNCMGMVGSLKKVVNYAYNTAATDEDVLSKVASNGFEHDNTSAILIHNGTHVLAADSTLASQLGANINFLANVSHCDFSLGHSCFGCIPIPHTDRCLPIAHHVLSPNNELSSLEHFADSRTRRYDYSGSLYSKNVKASAVVGTPTDGGSISGNAGVTFGGYSAKDSLTDSNGQYGASESADANLVKASASEQGKGELTKDGWGVTGSESANANLDAGLSEGAHADADLSDTGASFNVGANVDAKADANIDGNAQLGVTSPLGSDKSLITAQGSAGVSAHAGASASAQGSIGSDGVNFQYNANAGAGVSANAQGSIQGLDGAIDLKGNVGASYGPEVGTSGGFHATDKNGDISLGVSGSLAAGLGLHGGADINVNTNKIGDDIVDGVKKIGDDIEDAVDGSDASTGTSSNTGFGNGSGDN